MYHHWNSKRFWNKKSIWADKGKVSLSILMELVLPGTILLFFLFLTLLLWGVLY